MSLYSVIILSLIKKEILYTIIKEIHIQPPRHSITAAIKNAGIWSANLMILLIH